MRREADMKSFARRGLAVSPARDVRFRKNFVWTRLAAFGKRVTHGYGRFLERREPLDTGPWR